MYDDILVPTDGSAGSEAAVDHARDIASTYGARVHVLYVADPENEASHLVMRDDDTGSSGMVKPDEVEQSSGMTAEGSSEMDRARAAGQRLVEAVGERFAEAGVETVTEVRRGDPYRTIIDYADAGDVDMIVMSTHGRRGVDRYLLGSVTEKVVRTADVPVLTIRAHDDEAEGDD